MRATSTIIVAATMAMSAVFPGHAQETDDVETGPAGEIPLAPFAFFIGTWEHPDPERQFRVTMKWALDRAVVHWSEWGKLGPGEPGEFSQGMIGYDAAEGAIVFHDFFGPREVMFIGHYEPLPGGGLRREFEAHYGEGWNDRPPPGSKIRFRERWVPEGENGWRWTSEIQRNGEWRQYQPPVVMRRVR